MSGIAAAFNMTVDGHVRLLNSTILRSFSEYRTSSYVLAVLFSRLTTTFELFIRIHDDSVGKINHALDGDAHTVPMTLEQLELIIRRHNSSFNRIPAAMARREARLP